MQRGKAGRVDARSGLGSRQRFFNQILSTEEYDMSRRDDGNRVFIITMAVFFAVVSYYLGDRLGWR